MAPSYLEWNERLFNYYFGKEKAGEEVSLYADKQIIETLGAPDGTIENFIETVKNFDGFTRREGFCQKAYHTYLEWKEQPDKYNFPIYIAYLAFFVLTATCKDPEERDSYHRKLNNLVGMPERGVVPLPSFERIDKLWEDLQNWSTDRKGSDLGQFSVWRHGRHAHVGIPLSQSLISYEERKRLPCVFSKAGFYPDFPPSEAEMIHAILIYGTAGSGRLSSRLLGFLGGMHSGIFSEDSGKEEAYKSLIKLIYYELSNWDGAQCGEEQTTTLLQACISLQRNPLGYSAGIRIRLPSSSGKAALYGELNLIASISGKEINLICEEDPSHQSWSKRLKIFEEGRSRNWNILGEQQIWLDGASLITPIKGFSATLPGRKIRVFLPGNLWDLGEMWVESPHLEKRGPFVVACTNDMSVAISKWGAMECEGFHRIETRSCPSGWVFFKGANPRSGLERHAPLTLPQIASSRLEGGLKVKGSSSAKQYLQNHPPRVILEGGSGDEVVIAEILNEKRRLVPEGEGILKWQLPQDLPTGIPIRIDIVRQESDGHWRKCAYSHRIVMVPMESKGGYDGPRRGKFGEVLENVQDASAERRVIGGCIHKSLLER
mgnify:CR=1 FL=1